MNRLGGAFLITFCSYSLTASYAQGEKLHWSKRISADEASCLSELFRTSNLADLPAQETRKLVDAARVGRVDLNGNGRKEYIFIFHDFGWCGSAGCQMLIGEKRNDGVCHLLYEGYGYDTFTVLRSRDRGYHRLYLPCEARFDGDQYQQIHEECPNVNVIH
jgi:hypothetical protein